ncbi:hypothetical protein J6K35_04595 [bacterium]|nr:hypothetical protein [Lachnospiraceae bacterium]MBP3491124.1 hypothetical protein [bacterium]
MLEIGNFILSLLFYVLGWYVDIRFLKLMLTPEKECRVKPIYIYLIVGTINWASYWFVSGVIILTITGLAAYFIVTVVLYEGTLGKKIFSVAMIFAIGTVVEDFVWYLLNILDIGIYEDILGTLFSYLTDCAIDYDGVCCGGYFSIFANSEHK